MLDRKDNLEETNMDGYLVLPDKPVSGPGIISVQFQNLGLETFWQACRFVHELPYGYNSNKDDLMILFKEKRGTCTTKHAVIATLAAEVGLPVYKNIGIYAMSEEIVSGTTQILEQYDLPYLPMIHCFLVYREHRVDLTEGNNNGKNRSIEEFLFTKTVVPNISSKEEYLIYRNALKENILNRPEFRGINIMKVLHAREEGLELLKASIFK